MTERVQEERRWTIYIGPNGSAMMQGFAGAVKCPENYTEIEVAPASSLDQALVERDRLAEVAEGMAQALRGWLYDESEGHPPEVDATAALSSYEALKEEAKAQAPKPHEQ